LACLASARAAERALSDFKRDDDADTAASATVVVRWRLAAAVASSRSSKRLQ
jgi:hypothetical protein